MATQKKKRISAKDRTGVNDKYTKNVKLGGKNGIAWGAGSNMNSDVINMFRCKRMSTETHRYSDDVTRPTKVLLPVHPASSFGPAGASTSSGQSFTQRKPHRPIQKSSSLKDLFLKKNATERKQSQSASQSRTKIADIVQRHLLPLNILSTLRSNRRNQSENSSVSCPKLAIKDENVECSNEKENLTEVQYLSIPDFSNQLNLHSKAFSKADFLFTTSFTHSGEKADDSKTNDKESEQVPTRLAKNRSRSAQNLHKVPQPGGIKQVLTRSYSDVPPNTKLSLERSNSNLSTHLQSKMFRNEYISQLLDHLFIGSVEAAYNEPLLCKLKIDCLLDISNYQAADVPSSKKLHCPCMCPEENGHFRSRLIIQIEDKDSEDIESYFHDINKFIVAARHRSKRVLVFSYLGKSRAPAVAIQYMMSQENFLLRQAFNLVKNQRPHVDINPAFMSKLETLERKLFPDAKPSISFGNEYLNIADPQAIRCAWVDCDI